jgi:hypothetical protein
MRFRLTIRKRKPRPEPKSAIFTADDLFDVKPGDLDNSPSY